MNIRETSKKIFGEEAIERTSEVYGLDEEGELKGSFRPTGHPGVSCFVPRTDSDIFDVTQTLQLWFGTGTIVAGRTMSKQLVSVSQQRIHLKTANWRVSQILQIKAIELGLMAV